MKASPRNAWLFIGVLVAALTGCGGATPTAPGTGGTSAATEPALAPANAAPKTRIVIARPTVSLSILPLIVADERGFFADEGLEVEWVDMRADLSVSALINGEVGYSTSGTAVPRAAATGIDLKSVIVVNDRPQHGLVAQPEIADVRSLRGKTVALASRGDLVDVALQSILLGHGLQPGDVEVLVVGGNDPNRILALKSKQLDAAIIGVPFDLQMAREGFKYLAAARDYVALTAVAVSVTPRKLAEAPAEVERVVRATLRGLRHVHGQRDDVVRILIDYYNVDSDLAGVAYDAVIRTFPENGLPADGALEKAIELADSPRPVRIEDITDFRMLRRLLASP
jgi:NitT/TauT family transport system substrate-binding protein